MACGSCSFDNTVKVWDVETAKALCTFSKHPKSVYAIAFDRTGDLIASGALGGSLYIWNVKDCAIVKSFRESHARTARQAGRQQQVGGRSLPTRVHACVWPGLSVSSELSGDIFEVSWDRFGKRVAVAYSTGKVGGKEGGRGPRW